MIVFLVVFLVVLARRKVYFSTVGFVLHGLNLCFLVDIVRGDGISRRFPPLVVARWRFKISGGPTDRSNDGPWVGARLGGAPKLQSMPARAESKAFLGAHNL